MVLTGSGADRSMRFADRGYRIWGVFGLCTRWGWFLKEKMRIMRVQDIQFHLQ